MLKVKELNKSKAEIEKLKREKDEIESKVKADAQLEQLKKQLQEAQRKAELGSQQLQGEVQELAIEEYLQNRYPFDAIEEIKKGADVGVIVTEVLPKELDRMGLLDGVWVSTYEEFKGLSAVLRESIIKINQAKKSQENKTDKMGLLYTYLTSTEFTMQIEAIVEGFTQMQSDLDSEKRSMQRIWKQREKQIEKVLDNTIGMYGSIKGIAGNSIGNVKALELSYVELEDENG